MGFITKKKIVALGVAATTITAVGVGLYAEQLDGEHEALVADQVEIVKAARNVDAGQPLTKDRITTEKVPRKFLPPNPLRESELNIYLGTPVAVDVEEGAMILTSDFSAANRTPREVLVSPLVIKTANLSLRAEHPLDSGQAALAAVAKAGGYIVTSDITTTETSEHFSMIARVPAAEFEDVLFGFNELGQVYQRHIRGSGVTSDVQRLERKIGNIDFEIEGLRNRSKKARRVEKSQTIEIIAGDGGREVVSTVVETNPKAEIEAELQNAQGAKQGLEERLDEVLAESALATIEISIQQPPTTIPEPVVPTWDEELRAEFASSGRAVVTGGFASLRLLARALPLLIFAAPGFLGFMVWNRRRRRDDQSTSA